MKTININGKEYVLKSELKKNNESSCEYFEWDDEQRLHNTLNKIINYKKKCLSEKSAMKRKNLCATDSINVFMIIAKTQRAKTIIRRYINPDDKLQEEPKIEYESDSIAKSKYSLGYLTKMFDFFDILTDNSVVFTMKEDYPLTVENNDFKIILAPRVENN
jgi:hypothetical protein